jgi:hypothetical protein
MNYHFDLKSGGPLFLVESRICPKDRAGMKKRLGDTESFNSEFIGASVEECRNWLLEYQTPKRNWFYDGLLFIADERSAKDETLLATYNSQNPILFEVDNITLPQKAHTWYNFRIHYKDAGEMFVDLYFRPPDDVLPTYFLRTEELTDEHGIFRMDKARGYITGELGEAWPESSIEARKYSNV